VVTELFQVVHRPAEVASLGRAVEHARSVSETIKPKRGEIDPAHFQRGPFSSRGLRLPANFARVSRIETLKSQGLRLTAPRSTRARYFVSGDFFAESGRCSDIQCLLSQVM
jgi:hypothetical protein